MVQVERERTFFDQDLDICPYELSDAICDSLPLLDEQYAAQHITGSFFKDPFSNELLSIAAAG